MIRGLIFDVNGTVSDILTNEGDDNIYRVMSNFLDYQGITLSSDEIRRLYSDLNRMQRKSSKEEYPEFDVIRIFHRIIEHCATTYTETLPKEKLELMPVILAELFRAASRFKLQLYPDVLEVLTEMKKRYRLAALSDGQAVWAVPELRSVGLLDFFDPIIISSDLGYRKPDQRMFALMLEKMKLRAEEVIFIGNDMLRDVFGANKMGIKTIFFKSNQGEQRSMGAEADYIIYKFSELPDAVRFLEGKPIP